MTLVSSVRKKLFKVNLTTIEGDGEFPCPNCNTLIAPDDVSEDVYTVLSIQENKDVLESMAIQCNTCKSIITLNGFELLA
ncbi:MAG: hypothetical protein ACXABY_22170 [Candidatus Thorarchaeota archaeon]|jgi:predicted RNA-binding Zn-ribbon protein involved in translation (DUF1610 family)